MARVETKKQRAARTFTSFVIYELHDRKLRYQDLADFMGISKQAVSMKIRKKQWSLGDMADVCEFFGMDFTIEH